MDADNVDVIVVGGGASGMMAAGRVAELGAEVVLLEKGNQLGRKLLISGKGRCNLTNVGELDEFLSNFGKTRDFLRNVFSRFFNQDLMEFFESRGLKLKAERGGRIFPQTDKASSAVVVLADYLGEHRVEILFNSGAKEILIKGGAVSGVKLNNAKIIEAKNIILATGGKSYPRTGSTGDGYVMVKKLGHTVTKLNPALIPLVTKEEFVKELQGLSLKNVRANIVVDGKLLSWEFGEMLFTHFGISGPIILSLSGDVVELLEKQREVMISLDLKPALDAEQLEKRIMRDTQTFGRKIFKNYLKELLPSKMAVLFLKLLPNSPDKMINQLSKKERDSLIYLLKNFTLTVVGVRPFEEAIVTRGGVSVKEINPKTMESKLIKGLYFCGELIDVDAKTGGYNLQAAFSTGYIAGESAARAW